MAVKVKPGMFCERCDSPVAAQKQTHKARSLLLGPMTAGAAVKVGEWHCPDCGGPVVSVRTYERNLQEAGERAEDLAAPRVDVLLIDAGDGKSGTKIKVIKAIREATGLPLKETKALVDCPPSSVAGVKLDDAEELKAQLQTLGVKAELEDVDVAAMDEGQEDEASSTRQEDPPSPPSTHGPTDSGDTPPSGDGLDQIRKLGELRDAGVLTEEEFEAKKAELLRRL